MIKKVRRRFKLVSLLTKHFCCSICSEVLLDPMILKCGHTYCQDCIQSWMSNNKNCPECRKDIKKNDLIINRMVQQFISAQDMYCQHLGCQWTDNGESLERHERECIYEASRIPSWIKNECLGSMEKQEKDLDDLQMQDPEHADLKVQLHHNVPKGGLRQRLYMKSKAVRDKMGQIQDGLSLQEKVIQNINQQKDYIKDILMFNGDEQIEQQQKISSPQANSK